ncbi:MAG TPA: hypothetical protein VHT28_00655 [Silvibacterium sp.]|nr:hypothetical protein [Silvibacterium sp.]
MGKIQYPPPIPVKADTIIKQCFVYGEVLEVQFDTSGYFSHDNAEAFDPDPPTGNFVAPPNVDISQYFAAAEDNTVTFSFFDTANGKTYKNEITIVASKDLCPSGTSYDNGDS